MYYYAKYLWFNDSVKISHTQSAIGVGIYIIWSRFKQKLKHICEWCGYYYKFNSDDDS